MELVHKCHWIDLARAGIVHVDLATVIDGARREHPAHTGHDPLFCRSAMGSKAVEPSSGLADANAEVA